MLTQEEVKKIKIKAIMDDLGMKALASMCNVSVSMLSLILNGKRSSARVECQLKMWINEK